MTSHLTVSQFNLPLFIFNFYISYLQISTIKHCKFVEHFICTAVNKKNWFRISRAGFLRIATLYLCFHHFLVICMGNVYEGNRYWRPPCIILIYLIYTAFVYATWNKECEKEEYLDSIQKVLLPAEVPEKYVILLRLFPLYVHISTPFVLWPVIKGVLSSLLAW